MARNSAPIDAAPAGEKTRAHGTRPVAKVISGSDDAILRSVYQFHFLTALQVCQLFYDPDSIKIVRSKLKQLSDAGYLYRLVLPTVGMGKPAFIYTLARKGINYLRAAGFDEFPRFRPSEQERSFLFLRHTLAVNDFLIAADCLADHAEDIVLADFVHERALKKTPVMVTTSQNEKVGIVPDAFLDFHIRGSLRLSMVLELDRGTVQEKPLARKLRGLLSYSNGAYQQFFNTQSLSIAFATTAGDRRAMWLKRWCEAVLKATHNESLAEIFLFTALPENAPWDPMTLFLEPIWRQPFGDTPVALLGV